MSQPPVPCEEFIPYISRHSRDSVAQLLGPYNAYEARLRELFAQDRDHDALKNPKVNAIPIFDKYENLVRIKARKTDDEEPNRKFIMPLKPEDRKLDGLLAVVPSLTDFKKNFTLFSESSLLDLDWSNVVAAGSSVVTPLLPVPSQYSTSKKALR